MPFSGVVFANVSGAETAAPGQIVQSTVWNNIHTDYGTALTQLMSQMTTLVSNRNILEANGSADVWQRGAGRLLLQVQLPRRSVSIFYFS